uniref:Adenine DNA glycosylase C-terminal domain-containing protein n=1 Tax=Corethron hystrix TaxID=216773 RepID=A0A7S1FLC6_9STRA
MTAAHAAIPIPPPKKAKREEVLAVAAIQGIFCNGDSNSPKVSGNTIEKRWLMIQRSNSGLLAGQWEFPSTCLWVSEKNAKQEKKTKNKKNKMSEDGLVALIDERERQKSLTHFLRQLENDDHPYKLSEVQRKSAGGRERPLQHIFSHIRHTMYVETGETIILDFDGPMQWISSDGRVLQWMSSADFDRVGITSGVKKILNLL